MLRKKVIREMRFAETLSVALEDFSKTGDRTKLRRRLGVAKLNFKDMNF